MNALALKISSGQLVQLKWDGGLRIGSIGVHVMCVYVVMQKVVLGCRRHTLKQLGVMGTRSATRCHTVQEDGGVLHFTYNFSVSLRLI